MRKTEGFIMDTELKGAEQGQTWQRGKNFIHIISVAQGFVTIRSGIEKPKVLDVQAFYARYQYVRG